MGSFVRNFTSSKPILYSFLDPHLLEILFGQTKFLHHDMLMDLRSDLKVFNLRARFLLRARRNDSSKCHIVAVKDVCTALTIEL